MNRVPVRLTWRRMVAARSRIPLLLMFAVTSVSGQTQYDFGGRISGQLVGATYPEDSAFRLLTGSSSKDLNTDVRLIFAADRGPWDFRADNQFITLYGDTVEFGRTVPLGFGTLASARVPTDERRLFDLTKVLVDTGKFVAINRLDRLSVGHTTEKTVVRFGRQAISWGNGLIYAPMDIFNPFDPAAVDKEFKTGDDLLYVQFLRDNGDDLQSVLVFRRDLITGDVEADESALAFKYHGFAGQGEYDALVAQNYGDTLLGAGGNLSIGGAVWRSDLVLTFASDETVASFVTSISQSFVWGGKNVSGILEYFYNGFGQPRNEYDPQSLLDNPALLERLLRGELFTLGRNYLAASALIELNPLFLLTPNIFLNLGDPSALVQVVAQNDLKEDLLLFSALNIPLGANGSEFGGPATEIPALYLSTSVGVFVQIRWYF